MNTFPKQNIIIVALVMFAFSLSALDAFGQFGRFRRGNTNQNTQRQRQNSQNTNTAKNQTPKAEIILESNSSARKVWSLGQVQGEKPTRSVIKKADMPGASDVISWKFDGMQKIDEGGSAKFKFAAFDSDNLDIKASFTFFPETGKLRIEYNSSVGDEWKLSKSGTKNLAPTQKVLRSKNEPGAPTTVEWTLGSIVNNENQGVATFKFIYRGDEYTEVKIRLSK